MKTQYRWGFISEIGGQHRLCGRFFKPGATDKDPLVLTFATRQEAREFKRQRKLKAAVVKVAVSYEAVY